MVKIYFSILHMCNIKNEVLARSEQFTYTTFMPKNIYQITCAKSYADLSVLSVTGPHELRVIYMHIELYMTMS